MGGLKYHKGTLLTHVLLLAPWDSASSQQVCHWPASSKLRLELPEVLGRPSLQLNKGLVHARRDMCQDALWRTVTFQHVNSSPHVSIPWEPPEGTLCPFDQNVAADVKSYQPQKWLTRNTTYNEPAAKVLIIGLLSLIVQPVFCPFCNSIHYYSVFPQVHYGDATQEGLESLVNVNPLLSPPSTEPVILTWKAFRLITCNFPFKSDISCSQCPSCSSHARKYCLWEFAL